MVELKHVHNLLTEALLILKCNSPIDIFTLLLPSVGAHRGGGGGSRHFKWLLG